MWKSLSFLVKNNKNNIREQVTLSSQVLPQLSSEKYNVKRKTFSSLKQTDVNYFKSILTESRVLTEESDVLPFNIDWIKNCRGQSKVVLKPKSTEEVSKVLQYCNERQLAVCPQGGNTGLVGGSVPVFDEIVLNLALMNNIISLDEISGALVCEAGCILENLDNYVRERNLIMPLDLGAKGTCHIGGNASTNAGGLRLLRYGNLHGSILGIETVKADGTVIDCLRAMKKDNTGYHLKHLFIGSEGTLGVVTKIAIHCPVLPKAVTVGFFGVKTFENILQLYKSAKSSLGEILSAFEMADFESINSTVRNLKLPNPISEYPFYVLVETHGSDEDHDGEKLNRFLTKEMESGLILDGTVTSEPAKMQTIWNLRESIAGSGLVQGYVFKYDVSLPLKNYYELVPLLRKKLGKQALVFGYGHVGDGNIHINVTVPEYTKEINSQLEPFIFEEVNKLKGSISAEHGVGFRKPQFIHYSKDPSALQLMRDLKQLMDPNGILNPYKVLPDLNPISEYPFYVLVETHGSDEDHDGEKLNRFLTKEMESGLILDGTVTSEPAKMQTIWNLRESIAGSGLVQGYVFKYDVSLPLKNYYELVPLLRKKLGKQALVFGYGHVGDGNIHINVTVPEYTKEINSQLEPFIFEEVNKLKGSISAEHGVGFRKPQFIHYSKDPSALQLMRDLKQLMDPNGILNPYKVLPDL